MCSSDLEGIVNATTITKLITSPLDRAVFYQPEIGASHQCAITFLMDCSGSMQKHSHKLRDQDKAAFNKLAQAQFSSVFTSENVTSQTVLENLNAVVASDAQLASYTLS